MFSLDGVHQATDTDTAADALTDPGERRRLAPASAFHHGMHGMQSFQIYLRLSYWLLLSKAMLKFCIYGPAIRLHAEAGLQQLQSYCCTTVKHFSWGLACCCLMPM